MVESHKHNMGWGGVVAVYKCSKSIKTCMVTANTKFRVVLISGKRKSGMELDRGTQRALDL